MIKTKVGFCHKARLEHISQYCQYVGVCAAPYVTFIVVPNLTINATAHCDAVMLFLRKHGHHAWQS